MENMRDENQVDKKESKLNKDRSWLIIIGEFNKCVILVDGYLVWA